MFCADCWLMLGNWINHMVLTHLSIFCVNREERHNIWWHLTISRAIFFFPRQLFPKKKWREGGKIELFFQAFVRSRPFLPSFLSSNPLPSFPSPQSFVSFFDSNPSTIRENKGKLSISFHSRYEDKDRDSSDTWVKDDTSNKRTYERRRGMA